MWKFFSNDVIKLWFLLKCLYWGFLLEGVDVVIIVIFIFVDLFLDLDNNFFFIIKNLVFFRLFILYKLV